MLAAELRLDDLYDYLAGIFFCSSFNVSPDRIAAEIRADAQDAGCSQCAKLAYKADTAGRGVSHRIDLPRGAAAIWGERKDIGGEYVGAGRCRWLGGAGRFAR